MLHWTKGVVDVEVGVVDTVATNVSRVVVIREAGDLGVDIEFRRK